MKNKTKIQIKSNTFKTKRVNEAKDYVSNIIARHSLDIDNRNGIEFNCHNWNIGDFVVSDLSYGDCEAQVKVSGLQDEPFCMIMVPLAGKVEVTRGQDRFLLNPTSAIAFSEAELSRKEVRFRDYAKAHLLNICIPYETLKNFLSQELESPIHSDISFPNSPLKVDESLGYLINYLKLFSETVKPETSQFLQSSPHLANHMHDMLLSMMLSTVDHNYIDRYCNNANQTVTPFYVRRAEEYILENICESITIQDVAREVNVAQRTLHLGFQRYRNYTISEFLRNERLALTREELYTARERGVSITDVAYSCGFTHLGRFASAYRNRYGEKPSDTLKAGR